MHFLELRGGGGEVVVAEATSNVHQMPSSQPVVEPVCCPMVASGLEGQPLAPGSRTCEKLREIAYQR